MANSDWPKRSYDSSYHYFKRRACSSFKIKKRFNKKPLRIHLKESSIHLLWTRVSLPYSGPGYHCLTRTHLPNRAREEIPTTTRVQGKTQTPTRVYPSRGAPAKLLPLPGSIRTGGQTRTPTFIRIHPVKGAKSKNSTLLPHTENPCKGVGGK